MPQVQFLNRIVDVWVVTQKHSALGKMVDALLCRFTGQRHGKGG